jgi:ribosomal-protein-alanine N-acetyltransferase
VSEPQRPIPQVELVAATVPDLEALALDRPGFAVRMGSPAPGGWPQFPESVGFTIQRLSARPQEHEWWMHFFFVNGLLVGSGGYVGPPRDHEVEIGYEIAPGFRGKGYGLGAAAALVEQAFRTRQVKAVIAHTVATEGASTRVLARLGFVNEAEVPDPQQGAIWRWRLTRS